MSALAKVSPKAAAALSANPDHVSFAPNLGHSAASHSFPKADGRIGLGVMSPEAIARRGGRLLERIAV
jgi:hypothetical protein